MHGRLDELLAIINQYSPDLGDVLRGFMDNTGEDAYFAAEELIGAQRSAVNQALANAYAKRAQAVNGSTSSQTGSIRGNSGQGLFSGYLRLGHALTC